MQMRGQSLAAIVADTTSAPGRRRMSTMPSTSSVGDPTAEVLERELPPSSPRAALDQALPHL